MLAHLRLSPLYRTNPAVIAGERGSRPCHVQGDGAVAARGAQSRVDRFTFVAELVHHLESQQVTIQTLVRVAHL